MCVDKDEVSLWVVLESPVGAWVGEAFWPLPSNPDGDKELMTRIQCSLMSAILKQCKGDERFSLTLFVKNLSARPIDWAFQGDQQLQKYVLENAEVIAWKEWKVPCE